MAARKKSTLLSNVQKALEQSAKTLGVPKKAAKKAATKPPVSSPGTEFNYGSNPPVSPKIRELRKKKAYTLSDLPIKFKKDLPSFYRALNDHAEELDQLLKPGEQIGLQIVGERDGKKFNNKSIQTFSNFRQFRRHMQRYETAKSGPYAVPKYRNKKQQRELLNQIRIVKFGNEVKADTYIAKENARRAKKEIRFEKKRLEYIDRNRANAQRARRTDIAETKLQKEKTARKKEKVRADKRIADLTKQIAALQRQLAGKPAPKKGKK